MTGNQHQRIFFGWRIVAVCCIGMMFGPGVTAFYTLGVFMTTLTEAFDWSRAQVAGASTVGTLTIALCTAYAGRLIDSLGIRLVLLPAIAGFGLTLASMYFLTSSIWHLYLVFVLIGTFTSPVAVAYTRTVSGWFDRRRGLALGVAMAGTGIGAATIPLLSRHFIDFLGWRLAYPALALMAFSITFSLVNLILRDTPETMGLNVDGVEPDRSLKTTVVSKLVGASSSEATSMSSFWILISCFFLVAFSLHAVVLHFIPLLVDQGFTPLNAARLFSIAGVSIILGRLGCGYLVDKFFGPHVAAAFFLLSAVGIALLLLDVQEPLTYLTAALFGLGVGAETDLLGYLVGRYFGLKHFGELYGYVFAAFMIGTSIGPLALGFAHDFFGTYQTSLIPILIMLCVAAMLFLRLGQFPTWDPKEAPGKPTPKR